MNGVSIDGEVNGLVVNGVDVTEFVNANDRWYPLRTQLMPTTADGIRASRAALREEWSRLLDAVSNAGATVTDVSVNGEWSLRDTLRHLLFAVDKWFVLPLLGDREYLSIGLPNQGLQILYEIVNERDDAVAERAYAPWVDMEREMRAAGYTGRVVSARDLDVY